MSLESRLSKLETIVGDAKHSIRVLDDNERGIVIRNSIRQFARATLKSPETLDLFLSVYGTEEECSIDPELTSKVHFVNNDLGITPQEWICEVHESGLEAAIREERWVEMTTPEQRKFYRAKIVCKEGIIDQKPYEHHFSSWAARKPVS